MKLSSKQIQFKTKPSLRDFCVQNRSRMICAWSVDILSWCKAINANPVNRSCPIWFLSHVFSRRRFENVRSGVAVDTGIVAQIWSNCMMVGNGCLSHFSRADRASFGMTLSNFLWFSYIFLHTSHSPANCREEILLITGE